MANQVDRLEDDVAEIRRWTERHEERHGDDADMLQLVLSHLDQHTRNHHGVRSRATQVGSTGLVVAILGIIAEVLRRFVF